MHFNKPIILICVFYILLISVSCSSPKNNEENDENIAQTDDDQELQTVFENMVLNPTGNAPLTGEIDFNAEYKGTLEVKITGIYRDISDFSYSFEIEESGSFTIPVLGLFADAQNLVELRFYDTKGVESAFHSETVTTDPLPLDFPEVSAEGYYEGDEMTFTVYTRSSLREDLEGIYGGGMISYLAGLTGIVYDKYGNVRWYSDFPHSDTFPMEIIDGEIWGCAWLDPGDNIFTYDFMGNQVKNIDISKTGFFNIHHDIFKTEEGNYLLTSDKAGSFFVEDYIIELSGETFDLVRKWDLKKTIPEVPDLFRDVPISNDPDNIYSNDPIHVNAVWHDTKDDSIIVTMQRNGMAKIAGDGTLKWFLFPHIVKYIDDEDGNNISDSLEEKYDFEDMSTWLGDFKDHDDPMSPNENYIHYRMPFAGKPEEGTYPFDFHYGHFLLQPLDSSGEEITEEKQLMGFEDHDEFKWSFRPHSPVILKNGNIILFDNGLARNFNPMQPSFSRVAEYEIIEDKSGYGGTVRQVSEYIIREDKPLEGWSIVVSEVDELNNGNWLITSGSLGSVLLPDMFFTMYGNGPIGAYIVEYDPVSGEKAHSLTLRRFITDDHPNAPFSVYRSERINLVEGMKPLKKKL
jgi:arylsulfate sulfotransferase